MATTLDATTHYTQDEYIPKNIFDAFLKTADKYPDKTAVYFEKNGTFNTITYKELVKRSQDLGKLLLKEGIKEKDSVAIILENSPLWVISFMAVMYCGAVAVPLDFQLPPGYILQFLMHSKAKCLLTSQSIYKNARLYIDNTSELKVFTVDSEEIQPKLSSAASELSKHTQKFTAERDDIASIVYTSGTTDVSKGVMLTHGNFLSNVESIKKLNLFDETDTLSCLLPLHHTYPFTVSVLTPLFRGAAMSFPSDLSADSIKRAFSQTKITIMIGVPLLFERLKKGIEKKIAEKNLLAKSMVRIFANVPGIFPDSIARPIRKVLFKKVHQGIGPYLKFMVSGGAALDKECALFFKKMGFLIIEGYGLTESSPVLTFNPINKTKIGSAGKALPDVEIKIKMPDENGYGEVIARGPNIMKGYFGRDELTKKTVIDGWLQTNDMGHIDNEGYLFLKGRESELIVLESGENVNPEELEKHYAQSPFIKELCVTTMEVKEANEEKERLFGIIVVDEEALKRKEKHNVKLAIKWQLDNLSQKLPSTRRLKGFIVTTKPLPRTRLGKLIRYPIKSMYEEDLSEFREEDALTEDDQKLLASELANKIIEFLSTTFKKEISINDYFELDLGLDSLDRVEMLLKLEKFLGLELSEEEGFELAAARTVKDLILKAKTMLPEKDVQFLLNTADFSWEHTIEEMPKPESIEKISLTPNLFEKIFAYSFLSLLKTICLVMFRVKVHGHENIPKDGPVIICPNHTSYLDGPVVAASLKMHIALKTYFVGTAMIFDLPAVKPFKKLGHIITINPIKDLVETLRICRFLIDENRKILLFPEGQRSPDGELGKFRKGIGILLKETNISVIPTYIKDSNKAWPTFHKFPRFHKVEVFFGKPVQLVHGDDASLSEEEVYQLIADNLKAEVQAMKDRYSK